MKKANEKNISQVPRVVLESTEDITGLYESNILESDYDILTNV